MRNNGARECLSEPPLSQSILTRFAATLIVNILRGGFSFAGGILIARGLGASGYGDLSFLLGTFVAVGQLFDMGTSSAFYTFIARQKQSREFIVLYLGWVGFQFIATVVAVGLLLPGSLVERIWVGHGRGIVLLAFCASFLTTQAWGLISQLGEAIRKTVLTQAVALSQAVAHLALVAAAVYWNWLAVHTVMWLLIGEYALLVVTLGPKLLRENIVEASVASRGSEAGVAEFVAYCKPLAVYGCVAFLYGFADQWLLQRFGGAEQQGFFAVAQQFANLSLIASVSIMKVFWKEIAEADARQDRERVRMLYQKVSRGLLMVGAILSGFFIPWSETILELVLGKTYAPAWAALAIMFLYPIHQSVGQVCGTMLLSIGQTRLYVIQGASFMLASLPVSYVMQAPPTAMIPGLGWGSFGMALKMVVLNVIGVNVMIVMIARLYGWKYDWVSQVVGVVLLVVLGFATHGLALWIMEPSAGGGTQLLPPMLFAGLLYLLSAAGLIWAMPWLVGMGRTEIRSALCSRTWMPGR